MDYLDITRSNTSMVAITGDNNEIATRTVAGTGSAIFSDKERSSGKYYAEWEVHHFDSNLIYGIATPDHANDIRIGFSNYSWGWMANARLYHDSSYTGSSNFVNGDIVQIAVDLDTGDVWFGKNGTWLSGDPALGTSPSFADTDISSATNIALAFTMRYVDNQVELRLYEADFSYSIPTGFSEWGYTPWDENKKIILTLDKPSSDLTDFPVLINLTDSSGKNRFDCAAVFSELGIISSTFNPLDKHANFTLSGNDKIATYTGAHNWRSARCADGVSSGKWYFEFEYTDYIQHGMFGVAGLAASLDTHIGVSSVGWSYNGATGYKYHNNLYYVYGDTLVTDGDIVGIALDMDTGKIWFSKNGVWQDSGNPEAGTGEAFSSLTGTVYPTISDYSNGTIVTVQFLSSELSYTPPDGFSLIVLSETKKINIEDSNGDECYVEIENWDSLNKSAQLWCKVPLISSTENTELTLYYDASQEDNNSYVGDTGDTPAQAVWDINFKAVYHLGQDPSGGTDCILDSTNNENHGTPTGMSSTDLVEGSIGKALDFTPNEYITTGVDLGLSGDFSGTLEAIYTPENTNFHSIFVAGAAAILQSFGILTDSGNLYCHFNGSIYYTASGHGSAGIKGYFAATKTPGGINTTTKLFKNGIEVPGSGPINTPNFIENLAFIGKWTNASGYPDGIADEIRVSNTARNADWLNTTYLSNIDNFITFGGISEDRYISAFMNFPNNYNKNFLPDFIPSGLIRQKRKGFSKPF